ncbi:MAG: glycosyltransferase family 39 protein [Chloroflexi bacterium]|nr:glycosyltransferase family 39 protein [Chloroflexota bacterium]
MRRSAAQRAVFSYAVILFAAFALRLWNLGAQSLWHDEGWSLYPAYTLLGHMGIRGMDVNAPPLFNISIGLWLRAAGDAIWTVRFWSLLTGVIGVAVGIGLARRWFGDWAGALAGIFLGFSPILWVFSQEIRAYIPMPLYTMLLIGLAAQFLSPRHARVPRSTWLWLFGVTLAALWSHNLSVPLVAWLNVAVIGGLVLRRAWLRLRGWLLMQGVLFILYLPWLLTQRPTGTPLNTPPSLAPELLWQIWQSYFTGTKALLGADAALMTLCALFGALTVIGAARALWQWRTVQVWTLLSAALLLPLFQLLIVLAAHIDFHPRYFLLSAPPTLILLAAGLAAPPRGLPALSARLAAASLAVAIMARVAWLTYSAPIYQHDDFQGMARYYATRSERDAIVIPYGWEPSLDYYQEKLDIRASFVEVPIHSDAERIRAQLAAALEGKESAELFTWYQLPADMRGAFPCLLSAVGRHESALTLSGVRTDRYRITGDVRSLAAPHLPNDSGVMFSLPDDLQLHVRRRAFLHSDGAQAGCLILDFSLNGAPLKHDWRLAARLMRIDGTLHAALDSDLRDDQQRTALAQRDRAGFEATAFLALPMPPDSEPLLLSAWLYTGQKRSAAQLLGVLRRENHTMRFTPDLDSLPALDSAPQLPLSVNAPPFRAEVARGEWREIAKLVAAALPEALSAERDQKIALLWQAQGRNPISYIAFVHLVAADGKLIAQSDSEPAHGARPTSSWRAGEHILDQHRLQWHDRAYRGKASVYVGLYDLQTGARLRLTDGSDKLKLPREVIVE